MKSLRTTKSKISYLILLAIWLLAFFTYDSIDFSNGGTMLFYNGNIITMEKEHQYPEAVYIEEGIITSIGTYELLRKKIKSSTQIIDLEGKTLMPGFIDSHTHPIISSFLHDMIDLIDPRPKPRGRRRRVNKREKKRVTKPLLRAKKTCRRYS